MAYDLCLSDGRNVNLKIAPPRSADVMTYEHGIMTTESTPCAWWPLTPAIPVPHIYACDASLELCDAPYFFMEKLKGVNYEHITARPFPPQKRRRLIARSATSSMRSTRLRAAIWL